MQYISFASFGAGDVIFKQGDTGEHFYIILSGAVDVSVYTNEETKVRRLRPCLRCCMQTASTICLLRVQPCGAQALHSYPAVSDMSFADMSSS